MAFPSQPPARTPRPSLTLVLALAFCTASSAAAQPAIALPESVRPVGVVVSPRASVARLESELADRPDGYEPRWQVARAYVRLGLGLDEPDAQLAAWERGRRHALVAAELDSLGIEARYWLAVSAALMADLSDGRTQARLGEEAYRASGWVVAHDSDHAGAHHIQGRIQASVMRMGTLKRMLARAVAGGDMLGEASWEGAELHLRRAAELDPSLPVHHFELALTYRDTDRPELMRRALERTIAAPGRTTFDERYRLRARALLEGVG